MTHYDLGGSYNIFLEEFGPTVMPRLALTRAIGVTGVFFRIPLFLPLLQ